MEKLEIRGIHVQWWKGISFKKHKKQMVPNQSMSIQQIIERFVRNEPVPLGQKDFGTPEQTEDFDNPLDVDLEKLSVADLVDKQEYKDSLKKISDTYEKQQKHKAAKKAEAEKKAQEQKLRAEIEAEFKAKGNSADPA